MKKLLTFFFAVGTVFLFSAAPAPTEAASISIDSIDYQRIIMREGDGRSLHFFTLTGSGLDFLEENFNAWDHSVIQLSEAQALSVDANDEGTLAYVEMRLNPIHFQEKKYYPFVVYKANGDVKYTSDEKVRILKPDSDQVKVKGFSQRVISMTKKKPFEKEITIKGPDIVDLYNSYNNPSIKIAKSRAIATGGSGDDLNVTFKINPKHFKKKNKWPVRFYQDGELVGKSKVLYTVNPWWKKYENRKTRKFINGTNKTTATKRNVGLNVHWALDQADSNDNKLFKSKLNESNTKWVREHISYSEFMGEDSSTWIQQYDRIFRRYKKDKRRVVVMLAYGEDGANKPPSEEDWAAFTKKVVKRYKNHVDAWEIWNEPDLAEFLDPPYVDELVPLLRTSYPIIKKHAPKSIVLNGPIGNIRTTAYIEELLAKGGAYFDELSIHAYYCGEHLRDGNLSALQQDFQNVLSVLPSDKRSKGVWVTELGCTESRDNVDEAMQKRHIQEATEALLATGEVNVVMLYNIRNRENDTDFERGFGLMDGEGNEKEAWDWYKNLPRR